jgi:hypothetical protein
MTPDDTPYRDDRAALRAEVAALRAENQRLRDALAGRRRPAVWPVALALGVGALDAWGFVTVVGWVNARSDGHFAAAFALAVGMVAAHVALGWYTFGRSG